MPFIRYSRDKRGYETTVVLHAYRATSGAQRGRVLYLFRSPANLKVGRRAFDEEVTEALQHTHPDLNFDWQALQREMTTERPDHRDREYPRRPSRRPEGRPEPRPAAPAAPPPARTPIDDQTPLGQLLGSGTAARLRGRYGDLLQRIARRARTPEERDRLTERAVRLNPEEWPDEATIRRGAQTVETEWEAIAAELPQRRRGRRGGRNRRDVPTPGAAPVANAGSTSAGGDEADRPSDIMSGQGDTDAADHDQTGGVAGEDARPGDARDGDAVGAGHADTPADPATRLQEDD